MGSTQKLVQKYKGPYRIVEFVDEVTAKLQLVDKSKRTKEFDTFHISKLKSYKESYPQVESSLQNWKHRKIVKPFWSATPLNLPITKRADQQNNVPKDFDCLSGSDNGKQNTFPTINFRVSSRNKKPNPRYDSFVT